MLDLMRLRLDSWYGNLHGSNLLHFGLRLIVNHDCNSWLLEYPEAVLDRRRAFLEELLCVDTSAKLDRLDPAATPSLRPHRICVAFSRH